MTTDAVTTASITPADWPAWAQPVSLAPSGIAALLAAAASGALLALWLALISTRREWIDFGVCALPMLAVAALLATSQSDREQYLLRLLAAAGLLPVLAGFWATTAELSWTLTAVASLVLYFMAHTMIFVGLVVWMASGATRVAPVMRVEPAQAAYRFRAVLQAMAGVEPHFVLRATAQGWTLDSPQPDGRTHRIEMRLDMARGELRVREVSSAAASVPRNAGEASLSANALGDAAFDPGRPEAQRVWNRQWAATVLKPADLAAATLRSGSLLPTAPVLAAATQSPTVLIHTLAAIALLCGLAWQPTLARP